jgi:putative transposase
MPWKNQQINNPQWSFVESVLRKERTFGEVCRQYGISRKTGYKWWRRFLQGGRAGLRPRSRRPQRLARRWPEWVRVVVRQLRRQHPSWGGKKICWALRQRWPRRALPQPRTLERWSPRVVRRHRARPGPRGPALARAQAHRANDVWTMDFKGRFRCADGTRQEPLTVRDLFSRYVLLVQHVAARSDPAVRRVLTRLFRRRGLPRVIRVDNGGPFGGRGALGLSTLSVWWLRLGVQVEFTRPGHPQDNGAHEQMHRILKAETAAPPATTARAQHRRFQRWRRTYNHHRPHEALHQQVPARFYRASRRRWPRRLPTWRYPRHSLVRRVSHGGWISWAGRRRLIGRAFAAELIALTPLGPHCAVHLGPHLLGELHSADPGGLRPVRRSHPKP